MKLWEGLSQELNYNIMFPQRGVTMLAHSVHDVQSFKRHIQGRAQPNGCTEPVLHRRRLEKKAEQAGA